MNGVVEWTIDDGNTVVTGGGAATFVPRGARTSTSLGDPLFSDTRKTASWTIQPQAGWQGDAGPWQVHTSWIQPNEFFSTATWEAFTIDTASGSYALEVAGQTLPTSKHPNEPFGTAYTEPACPQSEGLFIALGPKDFEGEPGVSFTLVMKYCAADVQYPSP